MTPQERVNYVLRTVWDPIGCGVPRDEYDSYAEVLVGLYDVGLNAIDSAEDYLLYVEKYRMGLEGAHYRARYAAIRACCLVDATEYDVVWVTSPTSMPDTALTHRDVYSYCAHNGMAEFVVYVTSRETQSWEHAARELLTWRFNVKALENPTYELKSPDWWPEQWKR